MRPSEEPTGELDRLLRETKEYLHDSNLAAAGEMLEQLFQRWPDHPEAGRLLSQMWSAGQAAFRTDVGPLLDRIRDGDLQSPLLSFSKTLKAISADITRLSATPKAIPRSDDVLRGDIASIRSALSNRELEEAEARAKMAVLSFPDSDEILGLESEVGEQIRKDTQIRQWLEEAENHFSRHNWKAAIRLFNSAHRLDTDRDGIRKRIAEAFLEWAGELRHEDVRAALKLAETAVTFDPDNSSAHKLRADLAEIYRSQAVAKAMNTAKEHEAKGDFSLAENAVRVALEDLPDQLTLVLYLKELDKTKRSKQYEQELRTIQNQVLSLSTGRRYTEAENALGQFLQKYPESATALTLQEGVQRDYRQFLNTQIADKALQDIAPLAQGDLKALKQALAIASGALQQVGTESRLSNAIRELETRLAESGRDLADLLERAEDDILHGRFKNAQESLQSATAIDHDSPRIGELRTQLKRARTATRRNALNSYVAGVWAGQKSLTLRVWNRQKAISRRLGTTISAFAVACGSGSKAGFLHVGSALKARLSRLLAAGRSLGTTTQRTGTNLYSAAWLKHRSVSVIAVLTLGVILTGYAGYRYIKTLPEVAQLAINSSPAGAKVVIDGTATGITPYSASWELRGGETRRVTIRVELEDYEPFEEVVTLSADQLHPAPLNPTLKLTNVAAVIARLYDSAAGALKAGALISPEEGSVVAYLSQMKAIDPDEQYLPAEREELRREAIKAFKDQLSRLKASEQDGEGELTRLQEFARTFNPDDSVINGRIKELEFRKSRQKEVIELSIANGSLMPPSPGNALTALKNLETLFPSESGWVKERREETRSQLVTLARKKCESRSIDCDQFVISALEFFPGDGELQSSTNRRGGNATILSPAEERLSVQMEAALRNRRYVVPQQDSAVYLANEIQRTAPGYSRVLEVKRIAREETDREVEQLTRTLQESRALRSSKEADAVLTDFRRARSLLAATLKFWPEETRVKRQFDDVGLRIQDIEKLKGLERKFSVIHNHNIGDDCMGFLLISPYGVSFEGKDSFDRSLSDIASTKVERDELELKMSDRPWHFRLNPVSETGSITIAKNLIDQMREMRSRIEKR